MFTIDEDRNIQWTDGEPDSDVAAFSTPYQFLAIADARGWSKSDVTAIWNTFAGVAPFQDCKSQKQFKNRPFGLQAIWRAIQRLRDPEAASDAATEQPEAEKPAPVKRVKVAKAENGFREGSKAAVAVKLFQRKSGVSQADLMERFGWQPHSLRGFVSTLRSKHGINIVSFKHPQHGRSYRID